MQHSWLSVVNWEEVKLGFPLWTGLEITRIPRRRQIITDLLATDKSRYIAQPRPIIVIIYNLWLYTSCKCANIKHQGQMLNIYWFSQAQKQSSWLYKLNVIFRWQNRNNPTLAASWEKAANILRHCFLKIAFSLVSRFNHENTKRKANATLLLYRIFR